MSKHTGCHRGTRILSRKSWEIQNKTKIVWIQKAKYVIVHHQIFEFVTSMLAEVLNKISFQLYATIRRLGCILTEVQTANVHQMK